jgi:predicted DNA-binding transcriptional regulator YafY
MARKKDTITLSVPPGTKEKLEDLARQFQIFWGKSPSPSGLIAAIAQNELEVGKPFELNATQVVALQQSILLLRDAGYLAEAQTLSSLLLARGNLEPPMRQSILQQVRQPGEAWRDRIEEYIQKQQPFYVLYRNAQGQDLAFTARYGEIAFWEKRFYLQIWCDETEDVRETEFPELIHNRCLRLDRIETVLPTSGVWHGEGLDFIKVQLHFYGGMVKAYEPRANDLEDCTVGEVRQVTRKVSNPFWLMREVSRYWENCIIVSPKQLRDRFLEKIQRLYQRYEQLND